MLIYGIRIIRIKEINKLKLKFKFSILCNYIHIFKTLLILSYFD